MISLPVRLGLSVVFASVLPLAVWSAPQHPERKQTSPRTDEKPKASEDDTAYVRLWKTASQPGHPIRVTLGTAAKGAGGDVPEFRNDEQGYSFGNYIKVPSGKLSCEASNPSASKPDEAKFLQLGLDLRPGSYGTILVREGTDKKWHAEYIDDNRTNEAPESGQLTVRNLTPGLSDVSLKVADVLDAHFAAADGYLQVCGLNRGVAQISTHGTLPNGQAFEWTTEANFSSFRKATLLIYPDPYGRVRPRLYVDGPTPVAGDPNPADAGHKTGG